MAEHLRAMSQRFPIKRTAWSALDHHYRKIRSFSLRELFADDPDRGERMAVEGAGIYLDYSKNRITENTIKLLVQLASESGLESRIDAMFRGERINLTQNRPALHMALRSPRGASVFVDGKNVVPLVQSVLDKMTSFCHRVRRGEWKGHTGKPIRNSVNIGTGSFGLGPVMAYEALRAYSDGSMNVRFVTNVDGSDFAEKVKDLDPSETLFILCCGTSATPEKNINFQQARAWLLAGLGGDQSALSKHFVAVSSDLEAIAAWGVDRANVFAIWDWMGRYSVESAVGLSTMLAVGPEHFRAMLEGFHKMDTHFLSVPFERNLPVLVALLSVWYVDLFGAQTIAVFPYDQYLHRFPAYLQQLTMGSNGKRVTLIGTEVTQSTAPVYWGEVGTLGFQGFFQLMLQGTALIPCDFIAFAKSAMPDGNGHDILMANALAQSEALAFGRGPEQLKLGNAPDWLVPHLVCDGNRPSNTLLAEQLTPETLGKLISLYEHVVFTQGVIWNINSFDEWGLEYGNELAQRLLTEIDNPTGPKLEYDSSTMALVRHYRELRETKRDSGLR